MADLISYKNKWIGSYETLGFDTADNDLDFGQYALNEHETGYYIRTKPKDEAQFELVKLDYDISALSKIDIKGHAYYHEFRKADGKTIRIPTTYDGYWNLSRIKAYPQPERIEMVKEIPIFPEDEQPKIEQHYSIAHDSSTTSGVKYLVSSFTWSHECTGSDLTLIVGVLVNDSTAEDRVVSSITYNGDALTKIDADENGDNRAELWYRVSPDTGDSYTIEVTFGGTCDHPLGGATSLTGTDADPIGVSNKANGETTSPATVIVPTEADNSWVHDAVISDASVTVGAGQTQRWNTAGKAGSTETTTDKGDVTMSWTFGGTYSWAMVAVEIKEKAGGETYTESSTEALALSDVVTKTAKFKKSESESLEVSDNVQKKTDFHITVTNY